MSIAKSIIIAVDAERQTGSVNKWIFPLASRSNAKILSIVASSGEIVDPFQTDDTFIVASVDPSVKSVKVTVELTLESDLEGQKLLLERTKVEIDEHWKKRAFLFSVGSALLTAGVSIAIAFSGALKKVDPGKPQVSEAAARTCRDSLKRLPTLARLNGQTVQSLGEAIQRHDELCSDVLVDVLAGAVGVGKGEQGR